MENVYLQAKIDLDCGTVYTYTKETPNDGRRTDGLALITNGGELLCGPDDLWRYWDFADSAYSCANSHVNITPNGIEYIND